MSRILTASVLALSLLTAGTAAQAQSYTAPAGIPAQAAQSGAAWQNGTSRYGSDRFGDDRRTSVAPSADDALTTGSVVRSRRGEPTRR
ncbi:hypothetical protein [uncultured Methylobacterium sp.]|uniref:hypothetical protein n=1 Tax=uncultured Methylobacterium sp. TaxID=157278 RepID=UPI0035CA7C22